LGDLLVSADGRRAALYSRDEAVVLDLEHEAGEPPAPFRHDAQVLAAAFSPDGGILATLAGESLGLWDVLGRHVERRIALPGPRPVLASRPDVRQVGIADGEGVRLFDLAALRQTAAFDWGVRQPRALAFSPDGSTAALADRTDEVVLW